MLILTGARKREVLDAKREDFDVVRKQWRIPVTKTGRPRHVPLSDGVLQGHTQVKTTQRYAHLSQDTLLDAANEASKTVPLTLAMPKTVEQVALVRV